MRIDIIATGDELRSGSVIDTNSGYMADKLEQSGFNVTRHLTVGDDLPSLVSVIRETAMHADIAILTGGLGPTEDDLTAEAVSMASGYCLKNNEEAEKSVRDFFVKLKKEPGKSDGKQWLLPEKSRCIVNDYGTAPGFCIKIENCQFYFLPGVPSEMKPLFNNKVLSDIKKMFPAEIKEIVNVTYSMFGLPESKTGELLSGFNSRFPGQKLGLRAVFPMIYIKTYLTGKNPVELEKIKEETRSWVFDRTGKWIFSETGDSLETEIGKLLQMRKETLALAESCTGGLIASRMTDVAGSSGYFLFSGVTYSNEAKTDVLGVDPETIIKHGAVHEETAKQMAERARKLARATYGLSTSGIAGPGGGTEEKPVGTVCIGIATEDDVKSYRFIFPITDRLKNKKLFSSKALDLLRKEIIARIKE